MFNPVEKNEKKSNTVLDILNVYCPGLLGFIDSKIGTRLLKTSAFFASSPLAEQKLDLTRDKSMPRRDVKL